MRDRGACPPRVMRKGGTQAREPRVPRADAYCSQQLPSGGVGPRASARRGRRNTVECGDRGCRGRPCSAQVCAHGFRLAQHAQQVRAGDLGQLRITPAAARQLLEPCRELVYALKSCWGFGNAVEVGADADVIDTRDLADMLDVIRHVAYPDWGLRMSLLPRLECGRRAFGLPDVQATEGWAAEAGLLRGAIRVPAPPCLGDVAGSKVNH